MQPTLCEKMDFNLDYLENLTPTFPKQKMKTPRVQEGRE